MTWRHFETVLDGRNASILFDDGLEKRCSRTFLPELAWFGVYCRLDPEGAYWHPAETKALDSVESDLLRLCEAAAQGRASYVRRVDTAGIREYFVYVGSGVELGQVKPLLQKSHPGYRVDFDQISDPDWKQYQSWLNQVDPYRGTSAQ